MSTLLKALSRSDGNKKAMEPQAEGKADGLGPLPDPSPRSKFLRRRQGAINQESVVTGPGSTPYTRAVLPKSEAELSAIFAAFADKPLFAKLAHEQLVQVASIMGKASFKKGDALMREGERGDTFFILQAGTCAVTMGRRQVRNLKEGDGFGEIALIYNQPRTATVTATSDCEVFLMNRAAYRNEVVESIKNQRRQYEQFLSSVPLFASMKPSQRAKVADALRTKSYEPGQQIIKQGDAGDEFFIIEVGTVEISDENSSKKLTMETGKFFGEISLIRNVPRTANVTAKDAVRCLTLDRASFSRLFGEENVAAMAASNEMVLPTAATVMAPAAAAAEKGIEFTGLTIDSFKMGAYVGYGAFGYCRIAKHKETGTICALKAMAKGYLLKKNQAKHAICERNLLRQCNHSGVVKLYGSFQDESMIYLCLEFLPGGELFTLLGQKGRLSNDATRALGAEVVMVFDYIHGQDIIYRDLKPENVMLDRTGHVRLIDFGLAKVCPDRTWTMCGTPEYLAPEVVTNQGHNKSADYWTLGVLIYEMLVGVPPFYDETATDEETFNRILKDKPRFPSFVGANAKDIIVQLMTHDVTRRLGCMADGCEGIRNHYWFKGVDWAAVTNLTQEVPFVPRLARDDDLRHFEIEQSEIIARKTLFESAKLDQSKAAIFEQF